MENKLLDKSLEVYLKLDCLMEKMKDKGVISPLSSLKVFDSMVISLEKDIQKVNQIKKIPKYIVKGW